ncbi:hypothetical protein KAW18_06470 [candidate division WOR-3 bacterium]|nr:hypothetical protein [candidate division WOR-3 bacterium]MCK4526997.1 hypothetical protein [candidate division WOR-3 bacterium]
MVRAEEDKGLIGKVKKLKKTTSGIYSLLREVSNKQIKYAEVLEDIREKIKNLYAAMAVIAEASDSFSTTIMKSEELLSFVLSLSEDIQEKTVDFLNITNDTSKKLEALMGTRESIDVIVDKLSDLNQVSANTARNAEIKAYKAGASGKGFEVVANELSKLTEKSLYMVNTMVELLESLRDESKKVMDRFKNIQETLSRFETITEQLDLSSNELKDKFLKINNITDKLLDLLENINKKRHNIDITTKSLLSLSRISTFKAGRINLMLEQKEATGKVMEHHTDIHRFLLEKESPDFARNLTHLDLTLKTMLFLSQKSWSAIKKLKEEQIQGELELKEIQEIQEMLKGIGVEIKEIEDVIRYTVEKSQEGVDNIGRLRSFLEREIGEMEEVTSMQKNLSSISANLGRTVEMANDLSDQARVLSLYGKIESARVQSESVGLEVIANEMQSLSGEYSLIAEEVWSFFDPVNNEIRELDKLVVKLTGIIIRIKDIVLEGENIFKENVDQTKYLTEAAKGIRVSMVEQKKIVSEIADLYYKITETSDKNIEIICDLEDEMADERDLMNVIMSDLQSFNIIPKEKYSELRVSIPRFPLTLDPALIGDAVSNRVAHNIYRGLFDFGFSGKVYPLLVEEWTLSDDAMEWHFRIKDNVLTHSGRKIDAEDVKYSLERVKNRVNKFILDSVDTIRVGSSRDIYIRLKDSYMPFIINLATIGGSILSKDYEGDFKNDPQGVGPFKFVERREKEELVLESNSDYIMGKPFVSRLMFKEIENGLEAFKDKEVDITVISLDDISKIQKDTQIQKCLIRSEYLNVNYLGFNFKREDMPFMDKRVRQAMNYAVDKKALIGETLSGFGTIARGIFPPGLSVYDPNLKGYEYNPQKARNLLKEAGYPNGLPDVYSIAISESESNIRRAEFLKGSFAEIGVNIEIEKYTWKEFLKKAHKGETQMFLLGWIADTGDPNTFLFPIFHSSNIAIGGNTTFFSNKDIDRLIEKGIREANPIKRDKLYRRTERMIVEEAPWVFLTHSDNFLLVRSNIFGFKPDLLGCPHYEWVGVE